MCIIPTLCDFYVVCVLSQRGKLKPEESTLLEDMPLRSVDEAFAQFQDGWTRSLEVRRLAGQPYERFNGPMYEIDGMMISSGLFPREALEEIRQLEAKPGDVLISTYPRTGSTWLSAILYHIYNQQPSSGDVEPKYIHGDIVVHLEMHPPGQPMPGINRLMEKPSPRLMMSHLPVRYFQKQLDSGKLKVVLCTRDPRDMLISFYHFHKPIMADCYEGSFEDFFQLFRGGKLHFGDYFSRTREWLEAAEQHPNSVLVLKYEDIQRDHGAVVKQLAKFCGIELSLENVESVVSHTVFSSMKNNHGSNPHFGVTPVTTAADSQFVRKGTVGEWKEGYFTPEMIQEIRQMNAKTMGKFASWFTL